MSTHLSDLISELDWPTPELEEWRYSRVGDLEVSAYQPASLATSALPPEMLAERDLLSSRAATVLLRNGRVVSVDVDETYAAQGLRVGRAAEIDPAADTTVEAVDAFVQLNAAGADPVLVDVPRNLVVDRPVVVVHWVDEDGALSLSRVVVRAGENSESSVIELTRGSADGGLVVPVTRIDVAAAARLRHMSVQRLGPSVNQVGLNSAHVGQSADLKVGHVALGGDYARLRFDSNLSGRGATGTITALYAGDGTQMHDLRTFQRHTAPDTTSDLLFKGAVDDHAHAVYTGLIHITPEGRGTNATQSNRIIKLSPDAWAESVPNLEIEHNDVRCAHASTVGPIDPDQRFYLESRGVRPDDAERLVVLGFFAEVLATLPVGELAEDLALSVVEKVGDPS